MSRLREQLEESAAAVRARVPGAVADVALVLGSGLAGAVRLLDGPEAVPLADVPHVPTPSVSGHPGRLVFGRVGPVRVGVLQGRLHTYEGWSAAETAFPVRLLITLGARVVVLTNASGGVRDGLAAGEWMAITDHINLSGKNPLEGPNDPRVGPRFPDLSRAYDPQLLALLHRAAALVTQLRHATRAPMCTAAMTSGTVLMPTASAPSVRSMRISAGVSYDGPAIIAYTPWCTGMPAPSAARKSIARSCGS